MMTPFAQNNSPVIKRYSKIHMDKKYIISETIYSDGHIDNFITSVPLTDLRSLRANNAVVKTTNINWDEDKDQAGLQITYANVNAIEDAFNNAIADTEAQLNYVDGTFNRIALGSEFLNLKEEIQSQILLEKVVSALASAEIFTANEKVNINSNKELNDAIFLTNGEYDVALPHIQAIYNWVFADQYTGWYNRNLLLNSEINKNSRGFKLIDQLGNQNLVSSSYAEIVNSIIANPTFGNSASISLHSSSKNNNQKLAMEILHNEINAEITTPLISGDE
jgi:hypothetical protein